MAEGKISTPRPNLPSKVTPRTFEGKKYFGAEDVARIIGVDRSQVLRWHYNGWFTADNRAHDGRYLYEIERVEQLKSVYSPDAEIECESFGGSSKPFGTMHTPFGTMHTPFGTMHTPFGTPAPKQFFTTKDVAKIIGVTKQTVDYWRKKGWFTADSQAGDGRYLYEIERVMQLKSVYRPDWNQPAYLAHVEPDAVTDEKISELESKANELGLSVQMSAKSSAPPPQMTRYLTKEERQKIKEAVRMVDPENVAQKIGLTKTKFGWVCPECGNGDGNDKTGIDPKYLSQNGDHVEWHCYKCGCSWDNIALVAKFKLNYKVDDKGNFYDANEFPKALDEVAKLLGVSIDTDGNVHSPHAAKPEIFDDADDDVDESELKDYSNFYGFAAGGLKFFMDKHDGEYRGIPKVVYDYFWCGYVSEFGKAKAPAFIVPASKYSFLARFTGNENELTDEQKQVLRPKWHSPVSKPVFNFKRAAESDDPIIFLHEGEFDAMSTFFGSVWDDFINANGIISLSKTPHINTVAIMGTAITGKYKKRLRAEDIGKKFFVVLLDNDEAGIKKTPQVVNDLKALGHDAIGVRLSEKYNDANEFLQADPKQFAARIKEIYDAAKNGTLTDDEIFSTPADGKQPEIGEPPADDNSVEEQYTPDFSDYESVNGKINPDIKPVLAEAIYYAERILENNCFGEEYFSVKELSSIKRRHQIAALKVYMPDLHDEFFTTVKKLCKAAKAHIRELDTGNFFASKIKGTKQQNDRPIFSNFSVASELADFDLKNFQHEVNELARDIKKNKPHSTRSNSAIPNANAKRINAPATEPPPPKSSKSKVITSTQIFFSCNPTTTKDAPRN
ncbi:MAG: toprim domain-containing protein [Selenomonadaceae bacterium]|nr:toprim domain-containing protein [Selenomonadaceae bacterium]